MHKAVNESRISSVRLRLSYTRQQLQLLTPALHFERHKRSVKGGRAKGSPKVRSSFSSDVDTRILKRSSASCRCCSLVTSHWHSSHRPDRNDSGPPTNHANGRVTRGRSIISIPNLLDTLVAAQMRDKGNGGKGIKCHCQRVTLGSAFLRPKSLTINKQL